MTWGGVMDEGQGPYIISDDQDESNSETGADQD